MIVSTAVSLARTAGGRRSWQPPVAPVHWLNGVLAAGGPTASCTTLSPVTRDWSATLAERNGHAAMAVTATIRRTAQQAVVIALLMSDWRERQSRYRPTTPRVMVPKTVNTRRYTDCVAFSTNGLAQPQRFCGCHALSRSASEAPMIQAAAPSSYEAIALPGLSIGPVTQPLS